MNKDVDDINQKKTETVGIIHIILFRTYMVFLAAVVLGAILNEVLPLNIFISKNFQYIGVVMIIFGSSVVYWAQNTTSPKRENDGERDINFFYRGPYKYTRNPTNLALTVMSIGLGLLINSFYSIIFIIITYLISRFVFIKKQDFILEERYGEIFVDYKKKVRDWL